MIKTNRCELTQLALEDKIFFEALNINPKVRRFLGGVVSPDILQENFLEALSPKLGIFNWIIRLSECSFVGLVTLSPHHDGNDIELSYQLFPEYWGKGLAFEATQAILNYATSTLKLTKVISETQVANIDSRKLLERLGMRPVKYLSRFGEEQVVYSTSFNL